MADHTHIEWTEATWNPVTGCDKVSGGCKHCYALRDWPRLSANPKTVYYGREFTDVRCHPERLDQPLRWTRARRIFVNSMSDLFHPDVPDAFIDQVFAVMALAPQHTFQVLTKRPARMREYLSRPAVEVRVGHNAMAMCLDAAVATKGKSKLGDGVLLQATDINPGGLDLWPLPNVWLGVSVEDQATADERIPLLLQTPAAVRWISAEPLLGHIDLERPMPGRDIDQGGGASICQPWMIQSGIDWIVAGGESGPKSRPSHPDWFRSLRDQCAAASVPFLFKQWGEWCPHGPIVGGDEARDLRNGVVQYMIGDGREFDGHFRRGDAAVRRVGKKAAGRLLDGVLHNAYPEPKP